MLQHDGQIPPAPPGRPRARRSVIAAATVVCLLVAGIFIANSITLDDYVLTPGVAQPVGPLISVPSHPAPATRGQLLLTDVYESQVTALQWPIYQLSSNDAVYPAAALFGSAVTPAQAQQTGVLQMVSSSEAARVVALRRLGYPVTERTGAVVLQALPGTPAARLGSLHPGDAITAVDAKAISSAAGLTAALGAYRPGQTVTLSVAHVDGLTGSEPLVLASRPGNASAAYAGVEVATAHYFVLPFQVDVNSDGIEGPSAGLAFTLGIINSLSGGDLTGGHKVAATGVMGLSGAVGAVGGVPQKTIAVRNAGATVFLVPPANYHQALSKAGSHLDVIAVSSLSQALAALAHLGGKIPPLPAHASPSSTG